MNELIQITTDGQGSSVVKSARELHRFLEVKSRFADWFKNRVNKYGFTEGKDYEALSKNLESGGRELDYALSLNMAKELSMVERNEKGRQARQYFIQCEEQLRQIVEQPAPALPTTEQLLVQLLTTQQEQLKQLRQDVEAIKHTGHKLPPKRPGQQLSLPGIKPRLGSALRQAVTGRVNAYCQLYGTTTHETWTYLYKRLQQVYGIDVHRFIRKPGESLLDSLERYGHLDRLDNLVRAELDYRED